MTSLQLRAAHVLSRVLHSYADWRIGATAAEKRCYKTTNSVLFTFDDYGSAEEISEILQILADKQVKAMFFLVGNWADKHPEFVQQIRAAGHVLGNHSYSHPNLLKLSDEALRAEISAGLPSRWLRAPHGRANKRIRTVANQLGYRLCYWTIDSRDWAGAGVDTMRYTILSELHPGAVILFHIQGVHTLELLPSIIDDIRARGYQVTDMSESW